MKRSKMPSRRSGVPEDSALSPHEVKAMALSPKNEVTNPGFKLNKRMRRSPDVAESSEAQEPEDTPGTEVSHTGTDSLFGNSQSTAKANLKQTIAAVETVEDEAVEGHDPQITEEMIREEQALMKETEEEEEKIRQKAEAALAEEVQEKRIKRLKHLLTQSQFYAQFIQQRLADQRKEVEAKHALENSQGSSSGGSQGSNKTSQGGGKQGRTKPRKEDLLARDKALLDARTESAPVVETELPKLDMGTRVTKAGLVVPARQPMLFEGGIMRDYQLEGYEWLRLLYLNGVNGILADEMGLGKTIQCIALICHMVEQNIGGPFLIIGPLSTLSNWVSEFERFAPKLPVILYHGSQEDRLSKWPLLRQRTMVPGGVATGVLPIVITSYEVAMKDRHPLQDKHWELIVIDEGHRIKNFKCKLVGELKRYKSNNRLLLTGTPLQNNLTELWSLLNYLLPEIFSDLAVFESWFQATEFSSEEGDPEAASQRILQMEQRDNVLSTLHKILHPFMLRRVKADVELDIPPKKELLVFTPLSPLQEELYRALLNKTIHTVLAPEDEEEKVADLAVEEEETGEDGEYKRKRLRRTCKQTQKYDEDRLNLEAFEQRALDYGQRDEPRLHSKGDGHRALAKQKGYIVSVNPCSTMMDMRKLVNHPYLLRFPVVPNTNELLVDEELVTSSGKMLVLDAMLAKLKEQGHKVLIFSQMVMMLDLIEEYMLLRQLRYCRLDGTRSVEDRQLNIQQFNTDPSIFAFLVSTRAGGLGINLTAADTVIIYDSDWNPQCDLQAQDRCHRIGQTRPVVVYRLTTDGTIDRRMVERATGKRRLEKIVIKKGRFQGSRSQTGLGQDGSGISAEELLALLNSKDYVKSIQSNGYVYTNAELEELLDRSDLVAGRSAPVAGTSGPSHLYEVL